MAFDLASAKPVSAGFDLASAKPVHPPEADATPPPTIGNTLLGEGELLGSGIANIPHAAAHAVVDLTRRLTGGDTNAPDPSMVEAIHVPTGDAAKNLVKNVAGLLPSFKERPSIQEMRASANPEEQKLTDDQLRHRFEQTNVGDIVKNSGTVAGDLGTGALNVAGDVAGIAPAANLARSAASGVSSAIKSATEGAKPGWKQPVAPTKFEQAGLRTAENNPIARNVAGQSGREALTLHNRPVANTIAANEAGSAAGEPMTPKSLKEGRAAPNTVYDRVENALPTSGLNEKAATGIRNAGLPEGGRITEGSPVAQQQIEVLRTQLLAPGRQFTGKQIVNEMRGLRQEGFANSASEDVSNQQLGKAQLDMARAIEGHIADSLPTGGNVSLEQFQAARKALAKNYTVQNALRGGDVDMQVLARIYRNEPELLDGGTRTLAEFGDKHPEVSALPSPNTRYNPPSLARDVSDIDLKKPLTYVQPLTGAAARRVLTGSPEQAIAQANWMHPPRHPGQFTPIPKPPIAGLLAAPAPAPAMVNAGGGAATPQTLNNLGLTSDVQSAGAAHPGAPRPGAPVPAPPPPPAAPVEFRPPENWSSVLQPNGPVPPPAPRSPASMYADVLSQGVERPGLAAPVIKPPRGVPPSPTRAPSPEDAWFNASARAKPKQYADALSRAENNASGESAASVEAINRGSRPLATIDADGVEHPLLKDVTQIDRKAQKGSLIIDTSTGEIIDRGGLNQQQANGLRNRWASQESTTARQRLMAQALRN